MSQDVCHTHEECEQLYANLDPVKKAAAIKALAEEFVKAQNDSLSVVRAAIARHGHTDWMHHLYDAEIEKLSSEEKELGMAGLYSAHFGWGMAIRNWLRQNGFGEKELGVHNLDDVYINLIEDAVKL